MRKKLNEYLINKNSSKINILVLIVSIIICFMYLSHSEYLQNSNNVMNTKSRWINFINPIVNMEKINKLKKIKELDYFFLEFDFPKSLEKKYKEEYGTQLNKLLISKYDKNENYIDMKSDNIMIPKKVSLIEDISVGEKFFLDDEEYIVKGYTQSQNFNSFIIGYKKSRELGLNINKINVMINKYINDNKREKIINDIKKIISPQRVDFSEDIKIPVEELGQYSILLLILTSALNVIFIFMNILYDRTKQYFVYRFSGMMRGQFYKLLLFEVLLDFIISFTLAIIIFTLANELLVKGVLGVMRYQFRYKFISYVFVGYFAVYMVLIALGIRKYFNKSLMESYKR
ncbi:ABC transporter permease [Helcococcus kunzii]|uniref:ABC transporter permease n=1 Tax=Helcococcus kunzii TaxID=40091 RepID=UPI0024AD03E2|nr:FtsX-like permease family protein [Helcococcus kunzii]